MKLAILTDQHFGCRGDNPVFLNYFRKFYETVCIPYLLDNNITTVLDLGDTFDRRKFVNFYTLTEANNMWFEPLYKHGIQLHSLVGNHNTYFKNTNDINSMDLLTKGYSNITVYAEPTDLYFDGLNIGFVPWINVENYDRTVEYLNNTTADIIMGHFEIAGFEMDKGNVCNSGMDISTFSRFSKVYSGHFHHKSSRGNITYLGNQYQMTWADYGDKRGFHVFDTETHEMEFIENPYEIFHKITYDDGVQDFDYWNSFDYEKIKDSYIKIIIVNKQNLFLFDHVLDNLNNIGVSDISIIEDFTDTEFENDHDIIDQAQDTVTILNNYIDGLAINNVEPDRLKRIMRELYIEALNVETA